MPVTKKVIYDMSGISPGPMLSKVNVLYCVDNCFNAAFTYIHKNNAYELS